MDIRVSHEFDCAVERYWRVFFDEEFNRRLYAEIKVRERTVLERREEQGGELLHRVIRIVPQADLPGVVRRVVGDSVSYLERTTWSRARSALDVAIELDAPGMRDRFELRGTFRVVPAGEGRCRREFLATLSVRIPLVGGQIEKQVAEQVTRSYEVARDVTRRWLAEHPA